AASTRPGPAVWGARVRGGSVLPAGRCPCPGRPTRGGPERGAIPGGAGAGRGTRYAPAPGALPPRPRHPVCQERPAGASLRCTGDGHRPVPCHGDDLLAAPGGGGTSAGGEAVREDAAILADVLALLQEETGK